MKFKLIGSVNELFHPELKKNDVDSGNKILRNRKMDFL